MSERYTLDRDGTWINKRTGLPMVVPDRGYVPMPSIQRDVSYISPLTMKPVTSRSQRREEMKVHNVREVDPSEHTPVYNSKKWAERQRGHHQPIVRPKDEAPFVRMAKSELPERIRKTVAR